MLYSIISISYLSLVMAVIGIVLGLYFANRKLRKDIQKCEDELDDLLRKNILDDLNRATLEQIAKELQNRPNKTIFIYMEGNQMKVYMRNVADFEAKYMFQTCNNSIQ